MPAQKGSRVGVTASARKFGWGLADQMLSSVTNFMLGVLVARMVTPAEFGAFGLAYATYALAVGAIRALALEPLVVRFSAASEDRCRTAIGGASGAAIVLGSLIGTVCLLVGIVVGGPLRNVFVLLAIALPGLLVQEAWRFSFFALGRGGHAFANDLVWAGVLFSGAAVLVTRGNPSMLALMGLWVAGGCAAALFGLVQTGGLFPRPGYAVRWSREQRDLTSRFFGEFVVTSGSSQLSVFLIGGLTSLTDLGRLRAGQLLLGPLGVLFQGVGLAAVPEASRLLATAPTELPRAMWALSALLTLGALAWAGAALLIPTAVGQAVLGENWAGGRALLVPLAIGVIGHAVAYGPMIGLRALAAASASLRSRMWDAGSTLIFSVVGALVGGANGVAWGYAVAGCLRVPNWWWHFRRARHAYPLADRGDGEPGATGHVRQQPLVERE